MMSASKNSSSKHRPSQREGEAGKQQRHRDKRDRTSSSSSQIMRQGEGGGDGISNGGHHPYVHTNHNNLRGGSSRNINTPLHSPASPNSTTDNDFTDTDTDFSPDHREERYHRTKSPDGAQSVSSRTVRSHKTTASSLVTRSRNNNNTNRIHDDSVQLDLPMADLMAYLQVVANNSSNLPLTRRDDPELGRTVSSLTSEEYALKCAAFIPANVRILGGMYGKYGSVWDLPTSEEFDVATSTREPGISHGGPCCNALLKAMYDTESEVNNVTSPQNVTNKDLFDDDDDETVDTAGFTVDRTLTSFDTLVLNDGCNSNSMTWAQLLRKMKAEMQSVGFNQVPAVTSSYKFNLNEPFSLTPPDFKVGTNHKRALLIGCNYRNLPNVKLKACHDDVRSVKDFLVNVYGFPETPDYMTVLMDDKQHPPPTHSNITAAFKQLAEKSQPGDSVFVLFTGHGCRVLDSPIGETAESYDEAILPSDYDETGIIRDTLFFKTLLAPMKKGVTITCIIDCCHTGVLFDLPYLWTTKGDKGEVSPNMSLNNDFSFVRFLKVVKTLYESSVFTRIGKTVGTELDKQAPARSEEDMFIENVGSLETLPEDELPTRKKSFFEKLCSSASSVIINCGLPVYSDDEDMLRRDNSLEDDQSHYSYDS